MKEIFIISVLSIPHKLNPLVILKEIPTGITINKKIDVWLEIKNKSKKIISTAVVIKTFKKTFQYFSGRSPWIKSLFSLNSIV